jgi:hypothetical protein
MERRRWSEDEERALYDGFVMGRDVGEFAAEHDRTIGAVRKRLRRLGLLDLNGQTIEPCPPFRRYVRNRRRGGGSPVLVPPAANASAYLAQLPLTVLPLKAYLIERLQEHGYVNVYMLARASLHNLRRHGRYLGPEKCLAIETALAAIGLRLEMSAEELDKISEIRSVSVTRPSVQPGTLPIELVDAREQQTCLPLAAWFVARVGGALLRHADRLDAHAMLLHLGWGTAEPPIHEGAIGERLGLSRDETGRSLSRAARLLQRLAIEPSSELFDAHQIARGILFNKAGELDRQRLVLLSDTMYGSSSNAPGAVLALLAGRTQPFTKLRSLVRNQRSRIREQRGRPRSELRQERRWPMLWLGAHLPPRLVRASDLKSICDGVPRVPSTLSIGRTGMLPSEKSAGPAAYESGLERRVLELLEDSSEVVEFRTQATVIERTESGRAYHPDVALLNRSGVVSVRRTTS